MCAVSFLRGFDPFSVSRLAAQRPGTQAGDSGGSLRRPETPTSVRAGDKPADWKNVVQKNGTTVRVAYDSASSESNPVMYVEVEDKRGVTEAYRVNLKDIDPRKASRIGLIALATHKFRQDENRLAGVSALILEAPVKENSSLSEMNRVIDRTAWVNALREKVSDEAYGTEERQKDLSALLELLQNPAPLQKTDSVVLSREAEEARKKALDAALEGIARAEEEKRQEEAKRSDDPEKASAPRSSGAALDAEQYLLRSRILANLKALDALASEADPASDE